jgi:putative ABC transport system permease protein
VHPLIQDLILSFRSLRRSPQFTVVAVLTLTLGIAGNTLVFSLVNATWLRPLPYPEPHRLIILQWQDQNDISAAAFFLVKSRAKSLSFSSALYPVNAGVNISATGTPQYVKALPVSKDFFRTLGVLPEIGAPFNEEQDQAHAPRTAVLSYGLWQKFKRDPSAVGRDVRVNGESYKIIGIMPQGFRSYPDADIWLPLQLDASSVDTGNNCRVIGRLATGISRQQAQYELDELAREYHSIYPWSTPQGTLVAYDLQSFLVSRERSGLALLFAAVAFVLLIACSNVAILILVRAASRTQSIAIRAALGSSRRRLVFSLLTESLLLSVTGGVLGLILAKETLPLLFSIWPTDLPLGSKLSIDWHVVLFTFALSVLSSVLFGLAPGLKLSRVNLARALAHTSRTATASAEQVRTVRLLVFWQIALTVMLVAGTMLLVRSLSNLYSVPLGFDPEHVVVAQVSLAGQLYNNTASTSHLMDEIVKQLEVLPGVDAVAAVNGLPLENGLNLPLHPVEVPASVDHADEYRPVTPGYFNTLHIQLVSGRFFIPSDMAGSTPVAIVNETMARRWWPNTSAIGHYIRVDEKLGPQPPDVPRQIVGVVPDLHERGPGVPPPPTMFVPLSQTPDNITAFFNKVFLTSIVIRTSRRVDLARQVHSAIQSIDPDLPLASLRPFREFLDQSLANNRFIVLLTAAFSAIALLLTVVGIHGLLNYQARLRTREIAVRMAVGANRTHIVRMVVQQGVRRVFFALLAGLIGSFFIKGLLAGLLYNVHFSSVIVILATGLLLGLVAAMISLLTAVRAASIEPMAVLRNE